MITLRHGVLLAVLPTLLAAEPQNRPLPPQAAARAMTLPPNFRATVFAAEPDIVQPIAFTFDDRGRIWLVECLSYPKWTSDGTGNDRVVILEDTNGDGRFDRRTVFYDKGANLTGIAYGFGGVWLCSAPNLLFIPDRNQDDQPDGPPEVVLDGWTLKAKHNIFNGLTWGPDGWLWGLSGINDLSIVGKPGTPLEQRTKINCGVWRYHPVRQIFEPVAWGTTNPWGLDFDEYGEAFITNCVIHHLWHVVPGAHFQRMFGADLNPYSYGLIPSVADHIHWGGGHWTTSRTGKGTHSDAGGGHAHSGAMIYLGDSWPNEYRNGIFMCNIHGNRINHDRLERTPSGYVGKHAKDFLLANDSWFRGIAIHLGPDGSAYVCDWSDTGECHNYVVVDRSNGRLFKIAHASAKPWSGDLAKLSDAQLVEATFHSNDWFVRKARRLLQERALAKTLQPDTADRLRQELAQRTEVPQLLRAMWALHAIGQLDDELRLRLSQSSADSVRAWAVRLTVEARPQLSDRWMARLAEMADRETSAFVRLYLASALQYLPIAQREAVAVRLAARLEDAADAYIPWMIWYGIEPLIATHPDTASSFFTQGKIPLVRQCVARRLAQFGNEGLDRLYRQLATLKAAKLQRDLLRGLLEALGGQKNLAYPPSWNQAFAVLKDAADAEVRQLALSVALIHDFAEATPILLQISRDRSAPLDSRAKAVESLLRTGKPEVRPLLLELLDDAALRGVAIRGLAAFDHPQTPSLLVQRYPSLSDSEKADVIMTLSSRPKFALALLDAVDAQLVPRRDLTAFTIRQLRNLKHPELTQRLERTYGQVRETSAEKKKLIAEFRQRFTPDVLQKADLTQGRLLFAKNCAACHKLFGEGGEVGPELTGSQRSSLDYVLENVLDPNAVVAKEYRVTTFVLVNGRTIHGIIKSEDGKLIKVQTPNEVLTIPVVDIDERFASEVSMMPEGILEKLSETEQRDLLGYLASPQQVPLPK